MTWVRAAEPPNALQPTVGAAGASAGNWQSATAPPSAER